MKPLALVNTCKVSADTEGVLQILGSLGYSAVCVTEGPPVSFAVPDADRRERIATAVLAGLVAAGGTAVGTMCEAAVRMADLFIKELDK